MKVTIKEWLSLSCTDRYMAIYRAYVKNQVKQSEESQKEGNSCKSISLS
ncbi:hypothetical protein M3685_21925 [Heyndrickxia oleronia]|nr:hypothetical protein [Heyndrickxia oleronia]MCM3456562.1 hypothetical protein [Heyndrickxia oleronia]